MKTKRIGKIELLRFIMAVSVVLNHTKNFLGEDNNPFVGCSFAVEFFFITSGFLMAKTVYSNELPPNADYYLKKKVSALYPEVFLAWVFAYTLRVLCNHDNFISMVKRAINGFYDLFLINMSGMKPGSVNGPTWYLSSMLISIALIYPFLRKYRDKRYVFPLIGVMLAGYCFAALGSPRSPSKWIGFTFKGNLRAVFEMCFGILAYYIYEKIKDLNLTTFGKTLVTVIETGCYFAVIAYMYNGKFGTKNDYFFIILLTLAIALSFAHKGLFADFFDNKISYFLGEYSFPLFLTHSVFSYTINKIFPMLITDTQKVICYLSVSFVAALFLMYVSLFIRSRKNEILKIVRHLLICDEE